MSFVGKYETQLKAFAKRKQCEGIICGHIHTPADKRIDDVHYLNSGDWVESMTAIVETTGREMKLISYEEFVEMREAVVTRAERESSDRIDGKKLEVS